MTSWRIIFSSSSTFKFRVEFSCAFPCINPEGMLHVEGSLASSSYIDPVSQLAVRQVWNCWRSFLADVHRTVLIPFHQPTYTWELCFRVYLYRWRRILDANVVLCCTSHCHIWGRSSLIFRNGQGCHELYQPICLGFTPLFNLMSLFNLMCVYRQGFRSFDLDDGSHVGDTGMEEAYTNRVQRSEQVSSKDAT